MGKKGKPEKIVIDGVETSEMSFPKLQEFTHALLKKLGAARQDRNYLQAQCSELRTAWQITSKKLEDSKLEIKATAMKRDKMEAEMTGTTIKEISDLRKYLSFDLNERLTSMATATQGAVENLDTKWDENMLVPLLETKTNLKMKLQQQMDEHNASKREFEYRVNNDLNVAAKAFDTDTDKILDRQINRLNKHLSKLKLISTTSFFRTQEEYNKIIREMIKNGQTNTGLMREFYKRITEDDIIMIMVLEKQVKKLKKIVTKKHIMCKKINEQAATLESSKVDLELNLRRGKHKMKLYDTNTLALDRMTDVCDKLVDKKVVTEKEFKEMIQHESKLAERLKKMRDYINQFNVLFNVRQNEVIKPLEHKIKILNSLIKKDRKQFESILPTLPLDIQEKMKKECESTSTLSSKCMQYLVYDLARLCCAHDNFIDYIESSLKDLKFPKKDRVQFKRINFDTTAYGLGPVGLISKYP